MFSSVFALFMFTFVQLSECSSCVEVSSDMMKRFVSGQKIISGGIQHEELYSLRDCIKECWLQSRCKTITYHRTDLTCDIGGTLAVVKDTNDQNYVTSNRTDWPRPLLMDLVGVCGNHTCTADERCVALGNGKQHCIALTYVPDFVLFIKTLYWFGRDKKPWADAENDCAAYGGSLARLDSQSINTFCLKEMTARSKKNIHISNLYLIHPCNLWTEKIIYVTLPIRVCCVD
ncbi:uncharacterized protein LOC117341129 [Pecten maximus]|uniref:uncharacterized protein LOC117341129 n=1 Tax=Pecten maximus TaxID=6579 RepID=UPI00145860B0|nr:uncharacterized protein LOC117341129 [Pecten maximus]